MSIARLDFETYSEVDLKKCGAPVYAAHHSTDLLCAAYAFDDGPIEIWKAGDPMPFDLICHLEDGGSLSAWNAPFEFIIWNSIAVNKYGWPRLDINQVYCTMAEAYAMGIPGRLELAAPALGIEAGKDMEGQRIMLQLSKPKTPVKGQPENEVRRWTPKEAPEKFEKLYKYCIQDVAVERECAKRTLRLSPSERALWLLDHKINERGVQIDMTAVKAAIDVVELEKKRLNDEMQNVTGNFVGTCNSHKALSDWLKGYGLDVDGVGKADVLDLLAEPGLPLVCKKALLLRQEAAKSSTAKLVAMADRADGKGRVRQAHQYHGATTGRWAGRGLNTQNFPRPNMKQEDIEKVLELINGR